VSHNIALNSLNCSSNSLTALDVSNDTALSKLACYGNSIGYVMMDTLVNSLADRTKEIVGEFRVLNSAGDRNEITEAQVRAARAKNWNVLTADGKDYQGIKGIELTTRKAAGEYLQCVIKPSGASFVTVGATASATSVDSIFSCKLNSHNVTFIGNITRFECNDGALSRLTVNPAYNMDAVSCTNNYLRGSAMDALIASLTDRASSPSGGGPAVVCQRGRLIALQADVMLPGNASVENNIITKKQVAAAGEKGWDVYIRNSGQASDLTKYDGCDPVISLSGAKKAGSAITVKYTADGADSISGATGSDGTYTLTADTMRVAGLVTKLQCRGDSLSWINVSDNAALETLDCCDNAIAGKNMDALISSLPDRKYKTAGTLIAVDTAGDNNACTVVQVAAALARNWKVLAADGSPYQGTAGGINTVTLVTSRQVGKMIYLEIGSNGAYSLKGAAQMVIMGDVVPDCRLTSDTVTITGDITSLDCKGDELTSLDLGNDTSLNKLNCNDNRLTALDLSSCAKLTELHCNGDSLTALDLSRNTALKSLECDSNRIDSLDLSHNKALTSVSCKNNRITALGLSGCAALDQLDCGNNRLDSLDLSGNTSLVLVDCRNNSIRDALMDTLVNSLVNRTGKAAGTFIVIDTDGDNNVCTAAQVDVARAKNWNVKSADGNDYGGSPRTGIEGITSDPNVTIVGIYDLRGIRLARLQPGFNIIKLSNGTAKKVFIKE
jgi:Leucine-rich repeat (LRR) protein